MNSTSWPACSHSLGTGSAEANTHRATPLESCSRYSITVHSTSRARRKYSAGYCCHLVVSRMPENGGPECPPKSAGTQMKSTTKYLIGEFQSATGLRFLVPR